MCRGEGPVSAPNNESFESYIRKALIKELTAANLYNQGSNKLLNGKLIAIDYSSTMGAYWTIEMIFSYSNGGSSDISVRYPFDSAYMASKACEKVAQAFPKAVEQVLRNLIRSSEFKSFVIYDVTHQ